MPPDWPHLDPIALHGIAGEIVNAIGPHTEADPAALLVDLLVCAGNAIGKRPHALADGAEHPARLFAVIVGATSRSRKGTSRSQVRRIMRVADPEWATSAPWGGFGSGEGVINELGDRTDKRMLIEEGEFARVLAVTSRDGDTLSANIREAWDGLPLRRRTAKDRVEVTDHNVSAVGHITVEEVQRRLTDTEAANGFGNRIMWILARRSQLLPEGGNLDPLQIEALGASLGRRIATARTRGLVARTEIARKAWRTIYQQIADNEPAGLLGAVTARAEAQVLRLSVLYALLDGASSIEEDHVVAAWGLWRYAEASARCIFGDALGDPQVDRLLEALAMVEPNGLDGEELLRVIGRGYAAIRDRAERLGKTVTVEEQTGGRPRRVTHLIRPYQ